MEAVTLTRELAGEGILAGYPLGTVSPELDHCLLICTTEMTSTAAMDRLAARLSQVAAPPASVEARV
jgi:hypothetical protein